MVPPVDRDPTAARPRRLRHAAFGSGL